MITKFDGTFLDWPWFRGQFTETINKKSVAPIPKFLYLRELLKPKVKRTIEALPLSVEGYSRVKSILKVKFGKDSEIIKAYIIEILGLPTITGANPNKISWFTETFTYCVQALQPLTKLEQVHGATSMTLDKLPGICGNLMWTDLDWEKWDFKTLSKAICLWLRRSLADAKSTERDFNEHRIPKWDRSNKLYQARGLEFNAKECVYCRNVGHKPSEC